MRSLVLTPFAACLLLCPSITVTGQALPLAAADCTQHSDVDDDPRVILEIGAATSWNFSGGAATFAPNLAAETTPIENVLELEAGISPFYSKGSTEWDTDLLFKKPWTLSAKTEFMLGVGPEWVHLQQGGKTSNTLAGEIAGDFMFWPSGRHRFGWYLEPAYDYSFAADHQQSIGLSGGLLVGIARRHK
ncbi:hypothetical protein [Granulicella arctica]|uniref:hypothetical protein n=1 Tax=Granulicella arctica TaxID=940613 RepID=UPI0021E07313|nr:hypothetical protein [Granulicella arctica]